MFYHILFQVYLSFPETMHSLISSYSGNYIYLLLESLYFCGDSLKEITVSRNVSLYRKTHCILYKYLIHKLFLNDRLPFRFLKNHTNF